MKYLNRYLAIHVIFATFVVLAVLAGIESFMLFFGEMNELGKAAYQVDKVVAYVVMQLPFQLYQLFPMAGFLGCLIGLGRLQASSELVVMRASGVSIVGVSVSVIKAALLMILVMTLMGEGVAPQLQMYAEHMKAKALGKEKNYTSLGGIWLRNHNEFIHISQLNSADRANAISTFMLNQHHLLQSRFAQYADKKGKNWQMQNVQQTDFTPSFVLAQTMAQASLQAEFDPVLLSLGQTSVDQLSVKGLYQSIKYRQEAKLDVEQYRYVFWSRIFQPLVAVVMICLGVPFIFVTPRSQSAGLRVLMGIIIGFAFYTLNQFLGPLAVVYQIPPSIAAVIPIMIFTIASAVLFRCI
ncbi:MAG: LPS export ABC transporter permease LptG [Coxiella sp. RIFCSPHIGHO2_12_FULL_42_15]|nr:MAG: LPS export ABC transporter permease LptG [Coxiella sp. RIFCSPHIGHO2_12_FULL_42_15]